MPLVSGTALDRRMANTLAAGNLTFNPLYKEVKIRITRSLAAGEWRSGEALPSESRLAAQFNVSIGTVRKAIDELLAEKILLRQPTLQQYRFKMIKHFASSIIFFQFHRH